MVNEKDDESGAKVATLTFNRAVNYGAVLQTYALQKALKLMGINSEVLDYACLAIDDAYSKPSHESGAKLTFKDGLRWILKSFPRLQRKAKFNRFAGKYIKTSREVDRSEIKGYSRCYDLIIVGSDQVWNPNITGYDTSYFLDFVDDDSRKGVYAASIGIRSWDSSFESLGISLVSRIPAISVREGYAAEYLSALDGRVIAPVVCDPTLLLDDSDWAEVAHYPKEKGPYILVYSLTKIEEDCLNWAKELAKSSGEKLVYLHFGAIPLAGGKNVRGAGPSEFVGWVANADKVVTDSYHGCCLSIAFGKELYCFKSERTLKFLPHKIMRIESLLTTLGADDRLVCGSSELPEPMDYEKIDKKLQSLKDESYNYLNRLTAHLRDWVD